MTVPRGHVEEIPDGDATVEVKLGVWISNTKIRRANSPKCSSTNSPRSDSTGADPGGTGAELAPQIYLKFGFDTGSSTQRTSMTSLDWGTVPAWASAILTSGSLFLGFYILLRDRRKEEKEEARKLVFSVRMSDHRHVVLVTNVSDRPFLSVSMFNADQWDTDGRGDDDPEGPLLSGQSRRYVHSGRPESSALAARFQDADGQNWVKIFDNHRLVRVPDDLLGRHFEHQLTAEIRRTDQFWASQTQIRRWDRLKYRLWRRAAVRRS